MKGEEAAPFRGRGGGVGSSCCVARRRPCCPRQRRDGEGWLAGWAGKGQIKAPGGEMEER
jgi:hypothetical protein